MRQAGSAALETPWTGCHTGRKKGHTGARCYLPAAGLCRCIVLPSSHIFPVTPALYSQPCGLQRGACRQAQHGVSEYGLPQWQAEVYQSVGHPVRE